MSAAANHSRAAASNSWRAPFSEYERSSVPSLRGRTTSRFVSSPICCSSVTDPPLEIDSMSVTSRLNFTSPRASMSYEQLPSDHLTIQLFDPLSLLIKFVCDPLSLPGLRSHGARDET